MLDRPLTRLAAWLSRPVGFLATFFVVAAGLGCGWAMSWSDHFQLAFNLGLSIAALLLAEIILVAGANDTAALHAKIDELIRALPEADNRLVGIEREPPAA